MKMYHYIILSIIIFNSRKRKRKTMKFKMNLSRQLLNMQRVCESLLGQVYRSSITSLGHVAALRS